VSIWTKTTALLGCLALVALGGCSGDSADTRQRVKALESENAALKEQVDKLSKEVRPLQAKVDEHDVGLRNFDKRLGQVHEDLKSRVTDMVQQEVSGGGRRARVFPQPAPPPARFEEKAYMGFDAQDIEPDVAKLLNLKAKNGVLVTEVREGSPAAGAGIQKNDVITRLDADEIKNFQDLKKILDEKKPNQVVAITLQRGDEKAEVKVTLGTRRVRVEE
jgi:C-terminal processing protease CtpA/Prc